MIEGETDVGNQSLGLHQAANNAIDTKIPLIIYGMMLPLRRALKTAVKF